MPRVPLSLLIVLLGLLSAILENTCLVGKCSPELSLDFYKKATLNQNLCLLLWHSPFNTWREVGVTDMIGSASISYALTVDCCLNS